MRRKRSNRAEQRLPRRPCPARRPETRPVTARLALLAALLLVLTPAVSRPDSPSRDRQFTWMYGLSGSGGLKSAQRLGLNTLYLPTTIAVDVVEDNRHTAQAAAAGRPATSSSRCPRTPTSAPRIPTIPNIWKRSARRSGRWCASSPLSLP